MYILAIVCLDEYEQISYFETIPIQQTAMRQEIRFFLGGFVYVARYHILQIIELFLCLRFPLHQTTFKITTIHFPFTHFTIIALYTFKIMKKKKTPKVVLN